MQVPGKGVDSKLRLILVNLALSTVAATHPPPSAPRQAAVHMFLEQLVGAGVGREDPILQLSGIWPLIAQR